jgi:imidazolonepropionase-like amidohydrolase
MRTVIRHVQVFDGAHVIPPTDLLIEGDHIVGYESGRADIEIDGTGKTVIPGLIDAHTHNVDGDLEQALTFGVTTELDMFCLPSNLSRQRRIARERDDVADIRSAGVLATAPGGHPSQIMLADPSLKERYGDAVGPFDTIASADQAESFVKQRVAEGIDYLKIAIDSGKVQGIKLPVLQPDTVAALVRAGHAAGLKTIAHAVTVNDAVVALDAGIDGLGHVWADANPTDSTSEKLAARVARQKVFVITTLTYFEAVTGGKEGVELVRDERIGSRLSPEKRGAIDRDTSTIPIDPNAVPNALHAVQTLHDAGVSLLAGTDANIYAPLHGASLHRELLMLTQAGLTATEALAAATSVPARHFGLDDRGRIAPGLRADLVLVDGDPTRDITATRSIVGVWRRGVQQRHSRRDNHTRPS